MLPLGDQFVGCILTGFGISVLILVIVKLYACQLVWAVFTQTGGIVGTN